KVLTLFVFLRRISPHLQRFSGDVYSAFLRHRRLTPSCQLKQSSVRTVCFE
ncbi:unnamed protein product, partial [Arabidopsis halleri]